MRKSSSSASVISWHNDVRMQGRTVAFKTLRRPHMVRRNRLLTTAPIREELWLTCLKKENYPIPRDGEVQHVPAGAPRAGESPYSQTLCAINDDIIRVCDSEVDLKGGFPLPADTLASNVLSVVLCSKGKNTLTQAENSYCWRVLHFQESNYIKNYKISFY